jgi:hypothetical protein
VDRKVSVKAKTGGDVIQNPSDPDATYDGHKGPGYQTQLSETCGEENEVQLVTCAIPQTASASDADAPGEVLADLKQSGLLPGEILADTSYGSDENVQSCAADGVELVSPVSGKAPGGGTMTIGDFEVDQETQTVEKCPAGHAPESSIHDPETGKTRTEMDPEICGGCEMKERCPVNRTRNGCHIDHTDKEQRLDERRRNEATDEFREAYRKRSGIEGTNSGIKRRTGMARLRVRGKKSVFHAIRMKVAGWNILQAARSRKMRAHVKERMEKAAQGGQDAAILRAAARCWRVLAAHHLRKNGICTRNHAAIPYTTLQQEPSAA